MHLDGTCDDRGYTFWVREFPDGKRGTGRLYHDPEGRITLVSEDGPINGGFKHILAENDPWTAIDTVVQLPGRLRARDSNDITFPTRNGAELFERAIWYYNDVLNGTAYSVCPVTRTLCHGWSCGWRQDGLRCSNLLRDDKGNPTGPECYTGGVWGQKFIRQFNIKEQVELLNKRAILRPVNDLERF